ncbi:uncharacterized protein [Choristoneura fumiferana]|uniref:uncharacterized protein n=1 Tax=Choristoneura fumiferana TaxID=7141 RepID=UPI003D1550A7
MLRPTPMTVEAMQRIVNSFKQFEKKIDKLQDDISFHGQALMEIRVILNNMTGGPVGADTSPNDDAKVRQVSAKQTAGMQYEHHLDLPRNKGKCAIQQTPKKINKTKSFEPVLIRKPVSPKKSVVVNNSLRLKMEAARKTSQRISKKPEKLAKIKKRNKSQ